MKKIMFLVFVFAFAYAKGQDSTSIRKTYLTQVKFSVTQFFENSLILDYERRLNNGNGMLLSIGPVYSEVSGMKKSGFRTELQYKLYITSKEYRHTQSRIYIAPYLVYKYLETIGTYASPYYPDYKRYFHSFCPGIIAGWSIISFHRLVFDFYIGGGMKRTFDGDFKGKIDYDNYNIWQPGYNGVVPRMGFEMGITL